MYTSLKISKLIQAKVPEVDTETRYIVFSNGHISTFTESPKKTEVYDAYPRYTLADVVKAIKVCGEKKGWKPSTGVEKECRRMHQDGSITVEYNKAISEVDHYCHMLLTYYLTTLSLQSKEVEELLTNIFE